MGQGLAERWLARRLAPESPFEEGSRHRRRGMSWSERDHALPNGRSPAPLTRPSGTVSPSGGEGVKFNVYFPLAPTERGARGEGASPALSVSDFFTAPPSKGESLTLRPGSANLTRIDDA